MPTFAPVDFDPFAAPSGGVTRADAPAGVTRITVNAPSNGPKLVPVDHDPFAAPSTLTDVLKSAGVGLAKGAIGLAGLPGDVAELGAQGIDAASRFVGDKIGVDVPVRAPQEPTYGSAQLQRAIESKTGEFYKPQTTAGEYAQTIGEFAPGALMPGGVAARAGQVIVPALASETAGQLTKGTAAEPYARFAGALVGGIGTSLASRPGTAASAIRAQLPEGVTPQMVDQAQVLTTQARQQGIDLAWPEALSQAAQRPVLTDTMRHLEAAPQTSAQMAEFFARRPQQVEQAARSQFDRIAPVNAAPSTIGPQAGAVANEALGDVRKTINSAAEPYYKNAESVLLSPAEMQQVKQIPGYEQARDAVRNTPELSWRVAHLPDESVGFLNEVKKYFDQAGQNAGSKFNQSRNQQVQASNEMAASAVKQIGEAKSADYAAALAIQQQARTKYLQPLLDGPLGRLAKKDITTQKAINALFPNNPLPNSQNEISTAVSALAKRNPRAASDLVAAHVESVFNRAAKDLQTGANQAAGAKFRVQLIGNSQQRSNLQAAIEALPNGKQRWNGFNKFLDILEATGTRQGIGSKTAYNEQFFKEAAKGGIAGDVVKTGANPLSMGQRFVDRYQQWKLGRNLGQLADILTDPASGNMLRAIASAPNQSAARSIALRLATYTNASRQAPPVNESRK